MAAGSTYEPISTQTLGSASASVTLSSIPGTYTDLFLAINFGATSGMDLYLRFNGDSATNYSTTRLAGNGTSATSTRTTSDTGIQPRTPGNQASTVTTIWNINVMNYANSTTYKTALSRYGYASAFTETDVGLWRSTSAITSITLVAVSNTFTAGSTFTLYGILAA